MALDYFRVCVFIFFTRIPINGAISIKGYGSLKLNTHLLLECQISSFKGSATWSSSNMEHINCDNGGFCDLKTKDNFKFSGNTSGIYVIIDPLLKKDDLMKWTCFYDSTNISYTVKIYSSVSSGQSGLKTGEIAGFSVTATVLSIGALIVGVY